MNTIVSLTKAQVPSYLVDSTFYKNLSAGDDNEFNIPWEYVKPTLMVTNSVELAHLFHTIKFWGLAKLPHPLIELLVLKSKTFAADEHESVCKVLDQFDAEFGMLQLYQSQLKCVTEKERFLAAIQSGKEDVLEYVACFREQINTHLIKAAAENGHIRLLDRVVDSYLKSDGIKPFQLVSMTTVASRGHIDCLRFLLENGCKKRQDTCRVAAQNGHLACLKLAHQHKCAWNKSVRDAAALQGHLDCLKYTFEQGCPVDVDVACAAALSGQVECLRYILEQGVKVLKRISHSATLHGQLECLKLLRAYNAPAWDATCAMNAATCGHLTCLQYLLDEGCKIDHTATQEAAASGNTECLELLLSRECAARSGCVEVAAVNGHVACLKVLKKHNILLDFEDTSDYRLLLYACKVGFIRSLFEACYEVPHEVMLVAVKYGRLDIVEYMCANNICTLSGDLTTTVLHDFCCLPMLKVLRKYHCPWSADTCAFVAKNNDLKSLIFAHKNGAPWDERTTTAAIQHNSVACVEYLLKEDCPLSPDACDEAAGRGLCVILQLLHEHGCALTLKTCIAAATNKYPKCLTYALTHGVAVDASICAAAVTIGSSYVAPVLARCGETESASSKLQVLECAHQLGCPWDERTCAAAAAHAFNSECLLYARSLGCPWDAATTTAAMRSGNIKTLKYALANGCPAHVQACVIAAERGNLAALQLLHEHHVTWDESVSRAAAKSGSAATLRYCVENGCPIDAEIMIRYNASQAANI